MANGLIQTIREGIHDMCYIWREEMKAFIKDEGVIIFCFLVPIFYPLLYSWAYNNEVVREVTVTVIDQSHSHMSRDFIRKIDASPEVRVAAYSNSIEEARDQIASQEVHGAIYFPPNFETQLMRMQPATVSLYCDMSLMLTYKAIYQSAMSVSQQMNKEIQVRLSGNATAREDEILTQPLEFEEVPIFNTTGGYGNSILPAVLVLIIQQTLLLGIGLAAGTARERNAFGDLVPVSRHYNGIFRIVFGKSMCYVMIYAVLGTYLTLVVPRLFGFTSIVHRSDLFGLMVPYILACIFFGMMLSCLTRYRENVMLLVVFTSVPFLFLSGVSWPQSAIPSVWQGIGYLIPSTFGIRGFVRLSTMGGNLADVQSEYQMLWLQVAVYFLATCLVYRFQIINARKNAIERMKEDSLGAGD